MKKYLFLILLLGTFFNTFCQALPDSLISLYNSTSSRGAKDECLWNYLQAIVSGDGNEIERSFTILSYFKNQNDESGAGMTQLYIANRLNRRGDYVSALNMAHSALSVFEKRKDTVAMVHVYRLISNCYEFAQNFEQAISWAKKAVPYVIALKDEKQLSNCYNTIGATYAKAMQTDSGLVYAQKCVSIDMKLNDINGLPFSLSTLAENYIAGKNYDLALPFLKKGLVYALAISNPWGLAYTYLDLAQVYLGLKSYDSSVYYSKKSIEWSANFKETMMKSYDVLYKSFEQTGRQDSVFKYFRLATAVKDSVYSIEKTNNIQAINFREQLQQQEIETEKVKAEQERKTNIQYAAIAVGLIIFISLFLLLSRSIIVNEKWISFLGILGLLIVFEFINLFFHPYLAKITNHSPVLMLAILVAIAALLIPLHRRLEHWINHKMVEKNKNIRLAAARKTIEQLEKDKP